MSIRDRNNMPIGVLIVLVTLAAVLCIVLGTLMYLDNRALIRNDEDTDKVTQEQARSSAAQNADVEQSEGNTEAEDYLIRTRSEVLYNEATLVANTFAADLYNSETSLESVQKQFYALSRYMDDAVIWIVNPSGRLFLLFREQSLKVVVFA